MEFVIELKNCEENTLFGISSGTSYVAVHGKDAKTVVSQIEGIINGNSEMNKVEEVRVFGFPKDQLFLSESWENYLATKNPKFFKKSLQE